MGFMDELKKLTQPYDEDDDFYEDEEEEKPARAFTVKPKASSVSAEQQLESKFGAAASSIRNDFDEEDEDEDYDEEMSGGLFGNLGKRLRKQQPSASGGGGIFSGRERSANYSAQDSKVILFNPTSFDEAGELVEHLNNRNSVVMTLEGLPVDTARRLLDFISGIAFALRGKITPVSAKTYFISPENMDLLGNTKGSDQGGYTF